MQKKETEYTSKELMELPLLTIDQTAQLLQCAKKTVQDKIKNGSLPVVKLGRVVRINTTKFLKLYFED